MFRLHATFLSDAEFLVIFPEFSDPEVPFLPRLNVELILLNAMKATGGFCLYALAFPPDPTLRWYIPRARTASHYVARGTCRVQTTHVLARPFGKGCSFGLQDDASRSSLSRARRIVSARGLGPSYQTRRQTFSAAPFSKRQPTSSGRARRGDPNPFSSRSCESLRPREKETKQASILAAQPAFTM